MHVAQVSCSKSSSLGVLSDFEELLANLSNREPKKPTELTLSVRTGNTLRQGPVVQIGPEQRARIFAVRTGLSALLAFAAGGIAGSGLYRPVAVKERELASPPAMKSVVDWIICAESNGDPNARNKRSSATGLAQFIDQTWLHMIRAHRPDFARISNEKALELRRDPELVREITLRLLERNAALLKRHNLPVTPGTLYLSHFAGGAGAVALLTADNSADAPSVMAQADATGQMNRGKLVHANPFLAAFTVGDIKTWADNKMRARKSSCPTEAAKSAMPSRSALARVQAL